MPAWIAWTIAGSAAASVLTVWLWARALNAVSPLEGYSAPEGAWPENVIQLRRETGEPAGDRSRGFHAADPAGRAD